MESKIRIDNLKKYIDTHFNGSINAFAKSIEKNSSQFYNLFKGERSFGQNLARDIEEKLGLSRGYLDQDHDKPTLEQNTFRIPEYNVKLSANPQSGAEVLSPDNIVKYHTLNDTFLTEYKVKQENLAVVSVTGDSMEPTLLNGERVIIDISRREPIDNRVFAITTKNQTWVKRLRITPTGERWESDNDRHKRYDDELNECGTTVVIQGLVLYSLGRQIL